MINKAILVGRLGQDPELKYTPGGDAVCNISVATSRWKKSGEPPETTWHRVVCWSKLAENVAEYCRAGSTVYIEGRLKYNKYETEKGTGLSVDIVADVVQFLDKKSDV